MSPTTLTDTLRSLKGKEVHVHYGTKPVVETGTLISWTHGINANVWLTRGRTDITIPTNQIKKVVAA